jgi:hypothetical protein
MTSNATTAFWPDETTAKRITTNITAVNAVMTKRLLSVSLFPIGPIVRFGKAIFW